MIGYLLSEDFHDLLLFFTVFLLRFQILFRCNADYAFERLYDLAVLNLAVCDNDLTALHTSCCFHYNVTSTLNFIAGGREVIYLSDIFESDAYNFSHLYSFHNRWTIQVHQTALPAYMPASALHLYSFRQEAQVLKALHKDGKALLS